MQLVSYIAPGAPATRRPADGDEPFLRPEIGFTPNWYRQHLDVDFGRPYHTDPNYRQDAMRDMRDLLQGRFGRQDPLPNDFLTGVHGANLIGAIYGLPVIFAADNWPNCGHAYLSPEDVEQLASPVLAENPFFQELLEQLNQMAEEREGPLAGFLNWQGVLNNAQRLRGPELFMDLVDAPDRCRHLFKCIASTMCDALKTIQQQQAQTGFQVDFITVSNCSVNMLSPKQYEQLLLPLDQQLAETFGCIGIHNCAWTADPYLELYAQVSDVGYIDMGLDSDLVKARELFPTARRALMYTPMDLVNKDLDKIKTDLDRIAADYGPCDLVLADVEAGASDQRVLDVLEFCQTY